MQHQRQGGLFASLVLDGKARTICFPTPIGRRQEDLPCVFPFWNEHAVEANVINDDAVRQILNGKGNQLSSPVTADLDPGRDALAGGNGEFQRFPGGKVGIG